MRTLVALLLIAAVLFLVGTTRYTHAVRMRRLQGLLATTRAQAAKAAETRELAERLLPRGVIRQLSLLDIAPNTRNSSVALALAALPILTAGFVLGPIAALVVAAGLGLGAAMTLNLLAARRVAELGALLPGFFERVRQLLIVGNSLPTAFARAVHGAQPRLAAFFAPALRRISNGVSCSESIRQSANEIDLYEMRLFATAVATNMRFGGSLTHSLNNLVSYLRKRASIERELRGNTAQIRASAWVLGLLPMFVAGLIIVQNRDYAHWFLTHPAGRHMLIYCALSQIIGALVMRSVVKTKF